MPNKGSYADFTDHCEKLITNATANAAELPDLSVHLVALGSVLEEVKARGARARTRRGVKQQETKELQELLRREGRPLVSKLHAALKAHYGYTNPRLLEYGIKPLGQKKRGQSEEDEQQASSEGKPGSAT